VSDIVKRARKHEECVRLEGCENHDLILEMAAEIERLSLSPTQAEDVRREALDEIREPKGTLRTPNVHCRSAGGGDLYAIAWRAPRRAKP